MVIYTVYVFGTVLYGYKSANVKTMLMITIIIMLTLVKVVAGTKVYKKIWI